MQVTIENFCGIKAANFPLETITLIAGENAAGKSSIAKAVAAALAGQVIPVPGVLKNMAGMLVHQGAAKGAVTITAADGAANVEWPRATLKTKGSPPSASVIAVGLESLATMTAKERTSALVDLLHAVPTREDLAAHLKPHGISDDTIGNLWDVIERNGWDAAHDQAKETGARLKGQWEVTAGDRYGSKKAENFTPKDWEPELAGMSEDALTAAVTDARDDLDGMIAVAAVDDAEAARLKLLADQLDDLKAKRQNAQASLEEAQQLHSAAAAKLAQLPDPSKPVETSDCPHCGKAVQVVSRSSLIIPKELTEDDSLTFQAASAELDAASSKLRDHRAALADLEADIRHSTQAASQLQSLSAGNATQQQVDAARTALSVAQSRLNAFAVKSKADRINGSINQNVAIVSALDMAGVRQKKLGSCVQTFLNEEVAPLASVAGWGSVGIDGDMAITYGERAWSLLSESEKFRARVLLQFAIAKRDGSSAVVVDAADILGKAGRNGLIKMVRASGIPALICMTISSLPDVPDLAAAKLGKSFWVSAGILEPLGGVV